MLLHATSVAIDGRAILITGASGSGKSDLALRLIDRGAVLVGDDQLHLSADDNRLIAHVPETIAGRMEVRGVGIIAMKHESPMPVSLIIDLASSPARMPEPHSRTLCGVSVPEVALAPFEKSSTLKVELALRKFGLPA